MKKLLAILSFLLLASCSLGPVYAAELVNAPAALGAKPDLVEVITIAGEIDGSQAAAIEKQVEQIGDNPKVKAVLLVVNTPGGSVTASSAIYEAIGKLKVPVVGWCDAMCASGGVYALMSPSVKYIAVRNETISGSVGVIMQITRYNRLLDWAKIDAQTFKSGVYKDSGNPTRASTDEDTKYLQGITNTLAERFYAVVGKTRQIKNWPELKTAKVLIGAEAVQIGLADAVLSRDEALKKAKELSGSKLIFTREEIRKMSKLGDEAPVWGASAPVGQPGVREQFGDLPWLIEVLKEVRSGESIRFEYRLPFRF